nr:eukaryotic translation initiation factor 3 subunit B-like [Tanacetum cinerariifolium]
MVSPLLLETCSIKKDWEDENDFLVQLCKLSSKFLRVMLKIFNVISGKVMRDFKRSANEFAIGRSGSSSVFRWGGGIEDKYFARIGTNVISVYKTETFSLIDKKDINVENAMDLCWSPTDPIFALYVP